jgi:hypothetical protein
MQNKANFKNEKLGVSTMTVRYYMIFSGFWWGKNKPNQSQFKPNFNPKQTQTKPI